MSRVGRKDNSVAEFSLKDAILDSLKNPVVFVDTDHVIRADRAH